MIIGYCYIYTNGSVVEVKAMEDDGTVGIYFLPERGSVTYVHPNHLHLPDVLVDTRGREWYLQPSDVYRTTGAAKVDTLTLAAVHQHFGIESHRREEKVNPFNVGDIVRFKPTEYEVTRADHPDELEMKPVVEGEGSNWYTQPEDMELVRAAGDDDSGFWRHREQGYNLLAYKEDGSLKVVYLLRDGKVTEGVGMTREYLHTHFYKL